MDKKKPFLTVDFSNIEIPEDIKKLQENCKHKTLSILNVEPAILTNKFGIPFKRNMINYICEDCGAMFEKMKKK